MMNQNSTLRTILFGLTALIFVNFPTTVSAQLKPFDREAIKIKESVKLRSGATLFGKIINQGTDPETNREYTTFKTEDQSVLKLDSRLVSEVKKIDAIAKLYNSGVEIMDDTAEAHWNRVDWCNDQKSGSVVFKAQINLGIAWL